MRPLDPVTGAAQFLNTTGTFMKSYVITTGTVFGLVVVAHIWRATAEGLALVRDPIYTLSTAAAVTLSLWAWRLLRIMPRS